MVFPPVAPPLLGLPWTLDLISFERVVKAFSTLTASLAEVSKNLIPSESAKVFPTISENGTFFVLDLSVGFQVRLVSHQELNNVFVSVFVNLGKPIFDVLEGLSFGDVIDQDDPVSTLVVRSSDSLESLLSSGIPDLQLDGAAV